MSKLYRADNYERMRGLHSDGVVIDEPAQIDPRALPTMRARPSRTAVRHRRPRPNASMPKKTKTYAEVVALYHDAKLVSLRSRKRMLNTLDRIGRVYERDELRQFSR